MLNAGQGLSLSPLRSFVRPQAAAALTGVAALEAIFATMRRLADLKLHVIEFIALALGAGIIYFVVLYALEHSRGSAVAFWLVVAGAVLFRLTLAPLAPTLSDDLYRYRWDGHVQQAGWNPYTTRPDDPRLTALRDITWPAIPARETPTVYPPLTELIFRLTWRLLPGPVGFKLPFLLVDLLVVCMLAGWIRATGGTVFHLAIYAWNPLVIVEFAGSGHNDALAIAGLIAALVIIRRRRALSTLLLTAATLAKAFPAMLMPLWVRKTGWKNLLWAAVVAAICLWPYRSAWPQGIDTFKYYESRWQNYNASLYSIIAWFSGSRELASGLGIGVVAGLALWLAARRADAARAAYLLIGAILMLGPNGYSWYFTWIVPLLCFFPNPAWLLLTVLQFLSYNALIDYQAIGYWHFNPAMQWLAYGPFYALLLWQALRRGFNAGGGQRLGV